MEKRTFIIVLALLMVFISFFSLQITPSITGAHHTQVVTGRIIRDQKGTFMCNENGAKELAQYIIFTQGCSEVNYCGQILYGWLPRRNKVTIEGCSTSQQWKLLLAACARNYHYLCETQK